MFKFIANSDVSNLKTKLTCIYILNALDIVFTFGLLQTGMFYEANSLMSSIVENPHLSIFVKLILPALLILYLLYRLGSTTQLYFKVSNTLICLVLGLYTVIDIMHLYYTYTYFIL